MKVSKTWLKELVNVKDWDQLIRLLPLRTIGTKEITDKFIELDMKGYNRADLLSLRGVAYEVASLLDTQIKFKETDPDSFIWEGKNLPSTPVKIEDGELAQIQCVAKIEGLKVKNSSSQWQTKIKDSGMRTVNNIADVTNLVMLEYGQPLHAFDASKVKGSVGVRLAQKDERMTTLDGKIRNFTETDLLITDGDGPIGLAGVMGGKESEITDTTTEILLEVAIFDPK